MANKDGGKILRQQLDEVMHSSMIPYAEYVIMERALPRVEDGLKPVQRRILYTMMELSLSPDKPHRKSARIVGDCLGKYHPHGDSSVYEAMVRLAQDFNMSVPLVDGHGNFGSIDGDSAAAMRYTEARMTQAALELLRDINKETVTFSLNFDDTMKEPDTLPGRYPNLLVNGSSGIAVGLATNIPPHNMGESIDGIIALMKNPTLSLQQMMEHIQAPDFPTGGYCTAGEELINAYETGRGKIQNRAKTKIEQDKNGKSRIVITEIPYQVNKANMLEKIQRLREEKGGILNGISDIRDESDREGMRAVIELRKDADADKILQYLYRYSDLQVTFGINMVVIANGRPQQLGLMDICRHYVDYQKKVVTNRTRYDLEEKEKREHILEGLMIAVDNIDEVIRIIRSSENSAQAKERLMKAFDVTSIQAQAILDMRLRRLTALDMLELRQEYEQLAAEIQKLREILASEKKLINVIVKELQDIKKRYPQPRRTQISDLQVAEAALLMPKKQSEECEIILTKDGFIKRVNSKSAARSTDGLGEDTAATISCMTDSKLKLFTNDGNVFAMEAEDVPECKLKDRGSSINSLIAGLGESTRLVSAMEVKEDGPDVLFATRQGMLKRTSAQEYQGRRAKLAACGLKAGDELADVMPFTEGQTVTLATRKGFVIRFPADALPQQGRTATGVKGINLELDDEVILATLQAEGELVMVTDRGYAKRTPLSDFETQNRNGRGVKGIYFDKSGANGEMLAGMCLCSLTDSVIIEQKSSGESTAEVAGIPPETKQGGGQMVVLALFDDIVVNIRKAYTS